MIAGEVIKKPISNEQIRKLFDLSELGWAESKSPALLQRTTWSLSWSLFFFGQRGQENQRQLAPTILSLRKTPQGVECFKLNESKPSCFYHCLWDSEDESDTKMLPVLDSKSNQQWTPQIQLKMPRLLRLLPTFRGQKDLFFFYVTKFKFVILSSVSKRKTLKISKSHGVISKKRIFK